MATHKPLASHTNEFFGVKTSQQYHIDAETGKPHFYGTKKRAKTVRDRYNIGKAGLFGFSPYAKPNDKKAMSNTNKASIVPTAKHPKFKGNGNGIS